MLSDCRSASLDIRMTGHVLSRKRWRPSAHRACFEAQLLLWVLKECRLTFGWAGQASRGPWHSGAPERTREPQRGSVETLEALQYAAHGEAKPWWAGAAPEGDCPNAVQAADLGDGEDGVMESSERFAGKETTLSLPRCPWSRGRFRASVTAGHVGMNFAQLPVCACVWTKAEDAEFQIRGVLRRH